MPLLFFFIIIFIIFLSLCLSRKFSKIRKKALYFDNLCIYLTLVRKTLALCNKK